MTNNYIIGKDGDCWFWADETYPEGEGFWSEHIELVFNTLKEDIIAREKANDKK